MPKIIMRIEPSIYLSSLLGFPYFVEKGFTIEEALKEGIVTEDELREMKRGTEITKQLRVITYD